MASTADPHTDVLSWWCDPPGPQVDPPPVPDPVGSVVEVVVVVVGSVVVVEVVVVVGSVVVVVVEVVVVVPGPSFPGFDPQPVPTLPPRLDPGSAVVVVTEDLPRLSVPATPAPRPDRPVPPLLPSGLVSEVERRPRAGIEQAPSPICLTRESGRLTPCRWAHDAAPSPDGVAPGLTDARSPEPTDGLVPVPDATGSAVGV